MGDISQGLSYDPTFELRSPTPHHVDRTASPSGRRMSDIHIPSPDHSVSILSSEHFDKAGLIAAQEAALHDAAVLEMGWTGAEADGYAFMPEGEHPKSPAIGSLQDLKCLKPIRLRNMKIGKVHRGRILSGTLCCKSVKIFAVMNVLEEEGTGDATKFVISNAVPRSATTATAQRLYPLNAQLSVREPYLKRFADGMVGILVENPNDIIFNYLPDELPSPVSERENLLWPVYKDHAGDGPDTPVFNTYGSFLSSPSPLGKNSLSSPRTPRSPRSFLDDPLDGLSIRTFRKFKSFRKQDQGSEDGDDDDTKDPEPSRFAPAKSAVGDEVSDGSSVHTSPPCEGSSVELNCAAPGHLAVDHVEDGCKAEGSPKPLAGESSGTGLRQIDESNGPAAASSRDPSSKIQDVDERDSIASRSQEGGVPTGHSVDPELEATHHGLAEGSTSYSPEAGEVSSHQPDALSRVEGEDSNNLSQHQQAHGYETNGILVSQDCCEDEPEQTSNRTRGEDSDSSSLRTDSTDVSKGGDAQTEARGEPDVYPAPIAELENGHHAEEGKGVSASSGEILEECVAPRTEFENGLHSEQGKEMIAGSGENAEVCAPQRTESIALEPIVTESEESSSANPVGVVELQSESEVGVGVEESLEKDEAILVGTSEQEKVRSLVIASETPQNEEVVECKLPGEQSVADCAKAVVDPSVGQTDCLKLAIEDKLEASVVATVDSGEQVHAISQEGSLPGLPAFSEKKLIDGACVATSHPPEAKGELRENGIVTAAESHLSSNGSCSIPNGGERLAAEVEAHAIDELSHEDSPASVESTETCNGSAKSLQSSSAGVEASKAGTESDNGVCASEEIQHLLSNGCSQPAGACEESDASKASKPKEIIDAVVEEEPTAAALRIRGNHRFARQDWTGAIELYTRAIHKAVQESKEQMALSNRVNHVNGNGVETEMEVVMDYSNRAEAWLRIHHYERAWADAERALSIDPHHLKSLFRKGRALLGLGDYQQALTHLESAYARAPFDKDLLAAIKLSRIGDHQSRLGVYELTDFYLKGRFAGEIPTCADYVGPIQVKAASGDKGRGLFLTKHVEAGDLLLVSNPLAMLDSMSANKCRKNSLDSGAKGRLDPEIQEKLVLAVRERAKVSTKNRQRLLALCHGPDSAQHAVPSMDLFIPGRRVAPVETLNLEEERINRLVMRNAIDRNMVSTALERRHDPPRTDAEDHEERVFWGLWVLPSFINHSCIPNVSMVVIGRALFVYASRDLSAGEELLCSYFNVFQPLPQRREIASRCWDFTCKCARCLLETRFESSLKKLYSLHSRLEPNPEFVLQFSPFGYKAPAKDLAKELEVIECSKKLDHRERCWLQASFTQLYTVSRDFLGPHGNYPYLEAALHAMEIVCPGSNSTLEVGLLVRETALNEFHGKKSLQYKVINQQVLRICQCIYGKQKASVLQSLVDGIRPEASVKT
ncbi:protein MpATXR1 [Marchantia polymorpha subsp. ruderalis]